MKILLASGLLASVENTFAFDTTAQVYNFEVENTHTYYVGTEGVLVHNAYSANTVQNIKTVLTAAYEAKWTTFIDRVIQINAPLVQRVKLYDEISKITDQLSLIKFFDDFDVLEPFRKGLVVEPELISVWRSYKFINGIEVLRYIKNGNLSANELSRLTKIFNDGPELKGLVEAFGAANDVNGLKNLLNNTRWTDEFIAKLRSKLPRIEVYPTFADDLVSTVAGQRLLDVAENMLWEPENAKTFFDEIRGYYSESLERLSKSEFFTNSTDAGVVFGKTVVKEFTDVARPTLRQKLLSININMDEYIAYSEVQIKTGSKTVKKVNRQTVEVEEYFVADILLAKKKLDGTPNWSNCMILESKIKETTALTTPQRRGLANFRAGTSMPVRSIDKASVKGADLIPNRQSLSINDFYKVWSDGQNNVLNIKSLK